MPRDRDDRHDDEDDRPRRPRRRDDDEDDRPPAQANTGKTLLVVFGILGAVLLLCGGGAFALLWPAVTKVREAASRQRATNNVKQLGIAFHNFHDSYGKVHGPFADPLPGSPLVNPSDRLSWRAVILPFLEQDNLYRRLKLDKPWNGPDNAPVTSTVVMQYSDPLDGPPSTATHIRCFYDNGALFDSDPLKRVSLAGVSDGNSNTIAYIESTDTVPWGQFNEFKFDPTGPLPALGHPQRNAILALMADGSVKFVSKSINPQVLKAAITKNGNEPAPDLEGGR